MGHAHDHAGHEHGHDHHHHEGEGQAHGHAAPGHEHDHDRAGSKGGSVPFTAAEARQARRLSYVLALVTVFFGLELTGALYARSNVLKADAIHLLMDIVALAMSLIAMRVAVRKPTPKFTFGLRRAEPVAAIINAILVLVATAEIVHDGIEQLERAEAPSAGIMLIVSVGALIVNGISAWLLHGAIGHHHHGHGHGHGHGHDHHDHHEGGGGHQLNLRGARLHIIGDVLGSLAALVAALGIRFGGPAAIDPIASFVVALILLVGAVRLLKDAMLVLMEAAPPHLDIGVIRTLALGVEGVEGIHALHVWSLGAGHDAIMLHVNAGADTPSDLAMRVSDKLRKALGVEYVTVQVELTGTPRNSACDG